MAKIERIEWSQQRALDISDLSVEGTNPMAPDFQLRSRLKCHGFSRHSCVLPLSPVAQVVLLQASFSGASDELEAHPVTLLLTGHLVSPCVKVENTMSQKPQSHWVCSEPLTSVNAEDKTWCGRQAGAMGIHHTVSGT